MVCFVTKWGKISWLSIISKFFGRIFSVFWSSFSVFKDNILDWSSSASRLFVFVLFLGLNRARVLGARAHFCLLSYFDFRGKWNVMATMATTTTFVEQVLNITRQDKKFTFFRKAIFFLLYVTLYHYITGWLFFIYVLLLMALSSYQLLVVVVALIALKIKGKLF